MACISFFHDNDAFFAPQFPRKLALPDIHGKNFCRAILQKTIGKTSGGSAEVERGESGDVEFEIEQGMFEFVTAATDEFFRRVQRNFIFSSDRVAGLARGLGIDA